MNTKSILFTGLCLLTIALVVVTEGRKKGRGRGNKSENSTECLGEHMQQSEFDAGLSECTEQLVQSTLPASDADKIRGRKRTLKKNHMCIKMCQRKLNGILNANGSYSENGATEFVNRLFPQKAKARIQRSLNRCAENLDETVTVSENCREYKRFEKCLMRSIAKSCGWKNGKMKGNNRRGNNKGRGGNKKINQRQPSSDEHNEDDEYAEGA